MDWVSESGAALVAPLRLRAIPFHVGEPVVAVLPVFDRVVVGGDDGMLNCRAGGKSEG